MTPLTGLIGKRVLLLENEELISAEIVEIMDNYGKVPVVRIKLNNGDKGSIALRNLMFDDDASRQALLNLRTAELEFEALENGLEAYRTGPLNDAERQVNKLSIYALTLGATDK